MKALAPLLIATAHFAAELARGGVFAPIDVLLADEGYRRFWEEVGVEPRFQSQPYGTPIELNLSIGRVRICRMEGG